MRSFFGFDWSDEAFYPTGPYGLLVGKELFKDYWSVSQFGYVITLPFIFKKIDQIENDEIEKEKVIKSIIILAIIIILVAIFEVIYLGNSQTRILDMMKEG